MLKYIIVLFPLSGCTHFLQPELFKLETGEEVTCKRYEQEECGMLLTGCGLDESVEYKCKTKLEYLGPIDTE